MKGFTVAFGHYEKAISLCPVYPNWFLLTGAHTYRETGDISKAVEILQKAVNVEPESPLCRFYLIDALIDYGDRKQAKLVADEVKDMDMEFGVSGLVRYYSHNKKLRSRFRKNLAKMGFTK